MMKSASMVDCPICLNPMQEADELYPLLCPTECGYNFCSSCVEHLVESSKDDYQLASDGNRHVKVRLQCPQCRSNLSNTIEDTLLMRKAKTAEQYQEIPDSQLNARELRIKHEFIEQYAKDVEHAVARLRKHQRDNGGEFPEPLNLSFPSISQKDEDDKFVDTTLFQGLEYAMTDSERRYVQGLLISGSSQKLAQAAQILHGIFQLTLEGMAPKNVPERSWKEERRLIEMLEVFRKRNPLPAKMPKYVVLKAFATREKTITFKNDQWDGSIADAFSRVKTTKLQQSGGIDNILSQADDSQLHHEPRDRVLVASVKGQAGKAGIQKGDIVTHINGEEFLGTAEELRDLIASFHSDNPDCMFQLVFNAEDSIAEVLRLRNQACKKAVKNMSLI